MADTPNVINQSMHGHAVNFYCTLKIKGQQVISANIVHLVIREWIFDIVPRIEIILSDDGLLTEVYPLQDGDSIQVELRKNAQDTPAINLEFSLLSYTAGSMHGNKFMQLVIVGILKMNSFYSPIQARSLTNRSSGAVLQQIIATEGGALFNQSVQTNDVMTWLQIQISNLDFCKHILKRSYIANDTMFLYADTNGNPTSTTNTSRFNYTSFNTEVNKNIEGTARFHIHKFGADAFEDNADYRDYWFNSYNIFDFHSYVNGIRNYGVTYNYYNTTTGAIQNTVRSTATPMTTLTAKDIANVNTISHNFSLGYLPPTNVFSNYYKAMVQNDYYKHNLLSGFILELNINSISKPRLFGKVNVILPSLLGAGANDPLSGEYLITGIVHEIGKGDIYRKRIALMRNGFNQSQFMTINTVL